MATMQQIEKGAAELAAVRDALAGAWMAQQEDTAEITKKHLPRIRKLTREFKAAGDALTVLIAESPALFVKPRSVILHGIKAGFQKGQGALQWEDDADVVRRIKKLHPDLADVLIKTTEKPVKGALNELSAADLRKLGIEVEETGDVPFVKLADTDIAKMIKALLKTPDEEQA